MTADLTALFEQYYGSLVRMLYRRTGDHDRAEDLAQETFARAVAAPPDNPRPWLFAVALNLVREDGRRALRQGRRLELLRTDPRPEEGPETDYERNERSAAVRAALATLNDRDREALLLKAEGFNYEEIATTLGLSKGAIGTTLARARRRLVEAYRSEGRGRMSHLDEGTLHALLDGELDLKEVSEIQIHLGSCVACGSRLQEVKQFLAEADRLVGALETPSAAPRPRPEPSRAFAPSSPPPRNPPPSTPPREPEIWEPPPLLLPDAPDSQVQRARWRRGLVWAAVISVVLLGGRTIVDSIGPRHPMLPERDLTTAESPVPPPVASPEETGKPTPARAPSVATNQAKPTRPAAQDRAPLKAAPAPKAVAAAEQPIDSAELSDSGGFAYEDSAPADEAALAAGTVAESAAADSIFSEPQRQNDELATRRAAAEALAELDRQRRRERANAATAALPPPRSDVPAAESAPPPPRTLEQRAQIYTRIGLDEANKQLGGPVHVIEGMTPQFIGLTPGRAVAGADPSRPVVRVVYLDSRGRVILLDQQRLRSGQTPGSVEGSLRWAVGDVMLYLRGEPSADVLATLQRRVR